MADPGKIAQKHLDQLHGLIAWAFPILSVAFVAAASRKSQAAAIFGLEAYHMPTILWAATYALFILLLRTLVCLQELTAIDSPARDAVIEELRTYPTYTNPFFEGGGKFAILPNSLGVVLVTAVPVLLSALGAYFFYWEMLSALTSSGSTVTLAQGVSYFVAQMAAIGTFLNFFVTGKIARQLLKDVSEDATVKNQKDVALVITAWMIVFGGVSLTVAWWLMG